MLINCSECGQRVSDTAASCIHCGATKAAMVRAAHEAIKCAECGNQVSSTDELCHSCGAPKVAMSPQAITHTPQSSPKGYPTSHYVWSFIAAQFLSSIVTRGIMASGLRMSITPTSSIESDNFSLLLLTALSAVANAGIFIGIYSITKGVLVRRAFPWIAMLYGLGAFIAMFIPSTDDHFSPYLLNYATVGNLFLFLTIFAWHFRHQTQLLVPAVDRKDQDANSLSAEVTIAVVMTIAVIAAWAASITQY